ncbi:hypothetical protein WA1_09450 [Scytonema hofmannii PCC 7110]|uniref:DUF4079 domain-containing protein n=1 Tax=Scytonema hofmannii PCC 7110 TaxID=128403 RepID=A0A139WRA1_9CYAN|nr:DUF4079 domain-containing protein [Scytonema hofmannii]KYC34965.1 hypothetical protein WA1_09450 [Scytonema hofmannii PCC 7110]
MVNLTEALEPIAALFRSLGIPDIIVHWGHPAMMGIVIFVMGSFVGFTGWRGRLVEDKDTAIQSRSAHRKIAPWMLLFIALGYTGGVLSLVMQRQPILESSHFWTGSILLLLLFINGAISFSGFAGNKSSLRMLHAYLGSTALCLMFVHALLGIKLGTNF